jgi:EAL domain-containing protein (putative c-di-GMP-specific phosphodiesterase class I)
MIRSLTVVALARGLDMSVTAEGVETAEQLDGLKTLGVNFAQGYLLGRPVPTTELELQPLIFRPCLDELEAADSQRPGIPGPVVMGWVRAPQSIG